MAASSDAASAPSTTGRSPRYVYLVGRLRQRQITMEEATELFALMEVAIGQAEAARRAALAAAVPSSRPAYDTPPIPAPPIGATTPVGSGDEFLVMGLLMMGANAGLLSAITRRMQEGARPAAGAAPESAPK